MPLRLAAALRRNGIGNVARFGADLVRRHGLRQVVGYALTPRDQRVARLTDMRRAAAARELEARRRPREAASEGEWAVAAARWAAQAAAAARTSRAAVPALADAADAPAVHVVFADGAVDPPLHAAGDDWIVVLRPGDDPAPSLSERVAAAGAASCVEVVSFDMASLAANDRVTPVLAPGADPLLARTADVGLGRYALRARLLGAGQEAYAAVRAWAERTPLMQANDRWRHLPEPLATLQAAPEALAAARRRARGEAARELARSAGRERVSAVICTRDRGRLVRQLVRALNDPRIVEVVVVANGTRAPAAVETLSWVRSQPGASVLVRDEPFNFSRLSNAGAATTTGDRLLFLNDDIVPVSGDWLDALLAPLRDPEVGISGPLLLYGDERVQHAGMYLGYRGHAGHLFRHARLPEDEVGLYAAAPRQVSAVTGAVMMVARELFEALNGFDELLPTFLQDVDLCLRARAVGRATVWTPLAELLHLESTSLRDHEDDPEFGRQRQREAERFMQRWSEAVAADPFHNPAFDREDEGLRTLSAR